MLRESTNTRPTLQVWHIDLSTSQTSTEGPNGSKYSTSVSATNKVTEEEELKQSAPRTSPASGRPTMESHPMHQLPDPPPREKKAKGKRAPSSVAALLDGAQSYSDFSPFPPLDPSRKPPEKPKVYIRVVFLKIGEIDTLKEQFRAEIFVQARWREPRLDHCHNVEEVQWEDLWSPQLQVENAMDEPQSTVWRDLSLSRNREAFVLEKRRVKADFAENLELQNFPFDMQHLSILITSQLSDSSLELLEDEEELSSVNLLSFVDEQEWNVRDIVEAIPEVRCREFSSVKHRFPMITVRTYAIRRAGFFVWNVLAIMVLICSLSLCTFSVDRQLPQNRLQLSFTLVLTGIAFKFVVGQSLPKIPYLTVLDKYILGSMVLMHVVSVWHAVITRFKDHATLADTLDDWAFIVLIFIFFSYNVGYAIVMLVKTYIKRKFIGVLETAYKAKIQRLLKEGKDTKRSRVLKKHRRHHNHHHHSNANRVHSMQP